MRRVLSYILPAGAMGAGRGNAEGVLRGRVRAMSRWIETAGDMARVSTEEDARGMLVQFLREEMGVARVKYVPTALAGSLTGRMTLWLPSANGGGGEAVELTMEEGTTWGRAEEALARRAADMTDAVIASLSRLRDAQTQSMTDALTGLYNRRSLDRMLEREVLLATRHGMPLSVVAVDVDHFKSINDAFGHATGDAILKLVAEVLTGTLRRSDLAFRPGGDEFVVLLPQTGVGNALGAMEKVRRGLAEAQLPGVNVRRPTISVGVAELWRGATAMELLHAADEALYSAKRESRNCVRAYRAAA